MSLPVVVIHGGATVFKEEAHSAILEAVEKAARNGICVLDRGGSSMDAAESATRVLESTNLFTAGLGAEPNRDGYIELDSMIMDGHRLESGAVMAVRDIGHPISLARYVLERTPNAQIVGEGANKLYNTMIAEGYREEEERGKTSPPRVGISCDTVGCIVVDENGHIAATSSTSGWAGKLPGRVGDSPIIGSGVYANELAAASCTGKGEQILRIVMGRMAVYFVEMGMSVIDASQKIMNEIKQKTSGQAGLIMADKLGNVGIGFDTPHMPVAVAHSDEPDVYSSMKPEWSSQ
jgi:beta-aspartyl-peptidase (threonine type)